MAVYFYYFLPLKLFFTTKPILQNKSPLVNQPNDQLTKKLPDVTEPGSFSCD
jgi:hypothetical protein